MIRFSTVLNTLGRLLIIVNCTLILPVLTSLLTGCEDLLPFLYTMAIMGIGGAILCFFFRPVSNIRAKESFLIVSAAWIILSFLGSLPYVFAGVFPNYSAAFFETMSGFSTTGSTALVDIEILSPELLLWRSMTQWLGGLGVIVLFVAILPQVSTGGQSMFRAELSGPYNEKLTSRIRDSAKILWTIYLVMTIVLTLLLLLGGMSLLDAVCHSFSTMATGGFSTYNESIAAFDSAYIKWVITIFMFLAGVSYPLYYRIFANRSLKVAAKNEEFRLYYLVTFGAIIFVFVNLILCCQGTVLTKLSDAAFNVVSILTTTGFVAANFDFWPTASHVLLICMMMIGACHASTSGSIKMGTYLLSYKALRVQLFKLVHPRALVEIKINEKVVSESVVLKVNQLIILFFMFMFLGALVLGAVGLPFTEAFTAAMTAITNSGPATGSMGALGNFSEVPALGKWVLSFLMLVGRLEIYTFIVILMPTFWRR